LCPRITAFFCCFRRFICAASSAFKRNSKSGTVSARISLIFSYIPLVVVSVIIFCLLLTRFLRRFFQLPGFLRYPFKTHIEDSRRVCERANRDVVDTSLGDRPDILQSYVSGGFQLCLAGI